MIGAIAINLASSHCSPCTYSQLYLPTPTLIETAVMSKIVARIPQCFSPLFWTKSMDWLDWLWSIRLLANCYCDMQDIICFESVMELASKSGVRHDGRPVVCKPTKEVISSGQNTAYDKEKQLLVQDPYKCLGDLYQAGFQSWLSFLSHSLEWYNWYFITYNQTCMSWSPVVWLPFVQLTRSCCNLSDHIESNVYRHCCA